MKPLNALPNRFYLLIICLILGGLCNLNNLFAAYVILPNKTKIQGKDIRAKLDGSIVLETSSGSRTFMRNQYLKAVANRPKELDRAAALAKEKKFDESIAILQKVVTKYKHLEWDLHSMEILIRLFASKGDDAQVVKTYEKYVELRKEDDTPKDLLFNYFQGLMSLKQYSKLAPQLDALIYNSERGLAARAQLLRGDLKTHQNKLESAVLDYMRTALLFESEVQLHPEAIF